MADGYLNKCKQCARKDTVENRAKNVGYYKEYDKERDKLPNRVEQKLAYSKTPKGKQAKVKACRKWNESNKDKYIAHIAVNNAVRDGVLTKPQTCSKCGKGNCRIEGHHNDYSKPLEVLWLCNSCHKSLHKDLSVKLG
jgi:hypothetical protein